MASKTRTFKLKPGTTNDDIAGVFERLAQMFADESGLTATFERDGHPTKVLVPKKKEGKP